MPVAAGPGPSRPLAREAYARQMTILTLYGLTSRLIMPLILAGAGRVTAAAYIPEDRVVHRDYGVLHSTWPDLAGTRARCDGILAFKTGPTGPAAMVTLRRGREATSADICAADAGESPTRFAAFAANVTWTGGGRRSRRLAAEYH